MLLSKTIRSAGRCHQSSTNSFQSREQQRCPPTHTARMRPGAASTFKRVLLTPAQSNGANGEMASTPYSGELNDRRLDQTLLHRSTTPQSNFHGGDHYDSIPPSGQRGSVACACDSAGRRSVTYPKPSTSDLRQACVRMRGKVRSPCRCLEF
jgi:hypothetical protein